MIDWLIDLTFFKYLDRQRLSYWCNTECCVFVRIFSPRKSPKNCLTSLSTVNRWVLSHSRWRDKQVRE